MRLNPIEENNLRAGTVLVFAGRGSVPNSPKSQNLSGDFFKLVIVVSVTEREVIISPFSATWDDDDEDMRAPGQLLPRSVLRSELNSSLAWPVWVVGDRLIHRGRPAHILETKPGDLHVVIAYDDDTGGQFYGNLIWMDASPTLDLLDRRSAWPTLT